MNKARLVMLCGSERKAVEAMREFAEQERQRIRRSSWYTAGWWRRLWRTADWWIVRNPVDGMTFTLTPLRDGRCAVIGVRR